jgi:alpha-beta hydrolase superfamily lysophospholipase
MNRKNKNRIWFILKSLTVIYIVGGVILYFIQDFILFHPAVLPKTHSFAFAQPFKEVNIQVQNRNLNIVQFTADSNKKGIVLYFHGNRQNVERYAKFAAPFTKNRYEVWMPDYPGFGKTTGKRTEQVMYDDAVLLYKKAIEKAPPQNIIIYGKSLGTGIAANLASKYKCRQLILETPYYSLPSLAKAKFSIYPTGLMVKYSFPIYKFLPAVNAPVTILHGTADEVIPYSQAKQLKKENPAINMVTILKGRHNDLGQHMIFKKTLDSLLKE